MSFKENLAKVRAKEWGIDEKQAIQVARRIAKFISAESQKTGDITDLIILKSFFILNEAKKENYDKSAKQYALSKNVNEVIFAKADIIIELHQKGLGAYKISAFLLEKYNKKVSPSTIGRFLKSYKEAKENG